MDQPLIVCCSQGYYEDWREWAVKLTGERAQWAFFDDRPILPWERLIRRPNSSLIRASFQAVMRVVRGRARLLITQGPSAAFWCGLLCRVFGVNVSHSTDAFNFAVLPTGLQRRLMRYAFRQIGSFQVHSSVEIGMYSEYFDIPKERIRLRLWSIGVPQVAPQSPIEEGRYVSAIGGNGRDYGTLLDACRRLPEIPFVLVVRPENLAELDIPANVKALIDLPLAKAMNVLQFSAFTVLPLSDAVRPSGHVTLVCAMHLGKTVVATDSAGIADYVQPRENALLCEAQSAEKMAEAIAKLWADPEKTLRMGEANRQFGKLHCSETQMRSDLARVLADAGIPIKHGAVGRPA